MNPNDNVVVMKVIAMKVAQSFFFMSNMLLANNDIVYLDSFYLNLLENLDLFNEDPW